MQTNGSILERVILFLEIETYGTNNLINETIFELKLEQIELAFLNQRDVMQPNRRNLMIIRIYFLDKQNH